MIAPRDLPPKFRGARVIQVIEAHVLEGSGDPDHSFGLSTYYLALDGRVLAVAEANGQDEQFRDWLNTHEPRISRRKFTPTPTEETLP